MKENGLFLYYYCACLRRSHKWHTARGFPSVPVENRLAQGLSLPIVPHPLRGDINCLTGGFPVPVPLRATDQVKARAITAIMGSLFFMVFIFIINH